LPYAEAAPESLVALSDGNRGSQGILVRKNALDPLTRLLQAAEKDGIQLKVAAGFRSIETQRTTFESGAKKKGISLKSYAWWTAPPGFSEHHTGLAVDFVDTERPKTNFRPSSFSKTMAYVWLKAHANGFGFELSFGENSGLRVAFEPWHWRFVGDQETQTIFAVARQGRGAQDRVAIAQ
jgi:D-alanyl-D-alanine carboxypeptidase